MDKMFHQQRHIKVAPFYRERLGHENNSPWKVFADVKINIQSTLTTKPTSNSSSTNRIITTPFPKEITRLLTKYQATKILIQSGSSSSSTFPSNSFDEVKRGDDQLEDENDQHRHHLGPSGVSVRVQFLVSHVSDDPDLQTADCVARFLALLHELADQRWILAPLDMITAARLHRVIYPTTLLQEQNDNLINPFSTTLLSKVLELETILPMDGSAVSAEGVQAFFFGGRSNSCPSPNLNDDWSTSLAWSSILLGTSTQPAISTLSSGGFHRRRRRSMWLDLQSSVSCHDVSESTTKPCQMTISQGLQYAVMVESKPLQQQSSTKPKKKKRNRILLDQSRLPLNLLQQFGWCYPHSTSTRLEWLVPATWNVTWPSVNASRSLVEPSLSAASNSNLQRQAYVRRIYGDFQGLEHLQSLPQRYWLTVRPPPLSAPNTIEDVGSLPPIWSVERTVQRPRGVAVDGTLQTFVNYHPRDDMNGERCPGGMVAELMEVWPNYIRPRWRSLTTKLMTYTTNKTPDVIQNLSIRPSRIQQTTDGSILTKWHVPLPLHSSFSLSVDYDYVLMSFEDFPADPNRGMELPSSIATFYCAPTPHTTPTRFTASQRLYSDALLIMPPVPDMSMPFNILSLTSTLYAFCIGGLVNLLIRKSSERIRRQYEAATKTNMTAKQSLRDRIRSRLQQSKLGKLIWRTPTENGATAIFE